MIADSDSEFENKSVIIWVDEKENATIFKEKKLDISRITSPAANTNDRLNREAMEFHLQKKRTTIKSFCIFCFHIL